jgi:signal peptidase I
MTLGMDVQAERRAAWRELVFGVARQSGEVQIKVSGGSMLPLMWPGDLVTVQPCELSDLKAGEIVLHGKNEKLTVHRVTRIAADYLITRGDSLPCDDPPVQASEIVGRVVRVLRDGRVIFLEQSVPQRITARLLRNSGVARRVTVAVVPRLRHAGDKMTPWLKPFQLARHR